MVTRGCGNGELLCNGDRVLVHMRENSETGWWGWLPNNVNVFKATELYSLFIWLPSVLLTAHGILVPSCGNISMQHSDFLIVACRLSSSKVCGMLVSPPGIKPESPALQGEFSTTGQPGKSLNCILSNG